MGIFDSLTGKAQQRDIKRGQAEATGYLTGANQQASNYLNQGYGGANAGLNAGMRQGNQYLTQGAQTARRDIMSGTGAAINALSPYQQAGTQANTMYGNAIGLNGNQARTESQGVYMSDPIMQALMNQSNENVLQRYNASGLANSGVSRAAILQNQYNNYGGWLDRLNQQGQQGYQAAQGVSSLQANRGNALANIASNLGQQRADNTYRYGTQVAGNRVDLGRGQATNALNLGQQQAGLATDTASALANTRGMGWQNAMNLLGSGVNAATGIQKAGGLTKLAGGLF